MTLLAERDVHCPYCGELITLLIDPSLESSAYTEDCQVCCQPMVVQTTADHGGGVESVEVRREDET